MQDLGSRVFKIRILYWKFYFWLCLFCIYLFLEQIIKTHWHLFVINSISVKFLWLKVKKAQSKWTSLKRAFAFITGKVIGETGLTIAWYRCPSNISKTGSHLASLSSTWGFIFRRNLPSWLKEGCSLPRLHTAQMSGLLGEGKPLILSRWTEAPGLAEVGHVPIPKSITV